MRLLANVKRLESGAAMQVEQAPAPVQLVWSTRDERVDASELDPGAFIAVDVWREEEAGGVAIVRVKERLTYDAGDLGVVYDAAGARIGHITAIDSPYLEWELDVPTA